MGNNNFQVKLKQNQQLSQSMQQSLRILQMSGLEIEREIEDWLAENPILERKESPEYFDTITADIAKRGISLDDENHSNAWENISNEETLHEYLHKQVCEYPLSEKEAAHIHVLIDFIDDHGYLTESIEEIIENTPLEWLLDEAEMETALAHLRDFDPPGIATENLSQSLLHQLSRLPADNIRRAAIHIVAHHLNILCQNQTKNLNKIKKLLPNFSGEELQAALSMITHLNPYPAYGFSNGDPISYARPDVSIEKSAHGWRVIGNEEAPKIQINRDLADALQNEHADPVWRKKLLAAKQKIEMLQQRQKTIIKIANYILEKQEDFFIFGEIGLSPMLLKDCAAELSLAESTVSRAVSNKYLTCPQGLFPMRYFFSQNAVNTATDGEGISAHAIKSIITQLVENENKQQPLSDFALHNLLKQQGIFIARRTVAKYREQLGLPSMQQRRCA